MRRLGRAVRAASARHHRVRDRGAGRGEARATTARERELVEAERIQTEPEIIQQLVRTRPKSRLPDRPRPARNDPSQLKHRYRETGGPEPARGAEFAVRHVHPNDETGLWFRQRDGKFARNLDPLVESMLLHVLAPPENLGVQRKLYNSEWDPREHLPEIPQFMLKALRRYRPLGSLKKHKFAGLQMAGNIDARMKYAFNSVLNACFHSWRDMIAGRNRQSIRGLDKARLHTPYITRNHERALKAEHCALMQRIFDDFEHHSDPTLTSYTLMLAAYAQAGDVTNATAMLHRLKRRFRPDALVHKQMIMVFGRAGQPQMMLDYLEACIDKANNFQRLADRATHLLRMKSGGNRKDQTVAKHYHQLMHWRGQYAPDEGMLTATLHGLDAADDVLSMVNVFKQMKAAKIVPSNNTFAVMIKALGRHGDLEGAFSLLDEAEANQLRPSLFMLNRLLEACSRRGDADRAMKVLHTIERHGLLSNSLTVRHLLSTLITAGDTDRAMRVFRESCLGTDGSTPIHLNSSDLNHLMSLLAAPYLDHAVFPSIEKPVDIALFADLYKLPELPRDFAAGLELFRFGQSRGFFQPFDIKKSKLDLRRVWDGAVIFPLYLALDDLANANNSLRDLARRGVLILCGSPETTAQTQEEEDAASLRGDTSQLLGNARRRRKWTLDRTIAEGISPGMHPNLPLTHHELAAERKRRLALIDQERRLLEQDHPAWEAPDIRPHEDDVDWGEGIGESAATALDPRSDPDSPHFDRTLFEEMMGERLYEERMAELRAAIAREWADPERHEDTSLIDYFERRFGRKNHYQTQVAVGGGGGALSEFEDGGYGDPRKREEAERRFEAEEALLREPIGSKRWAVLHTLRGIAPRLRPHFHRREPLPLEQLPHSYTPDQLGYTTDDGFSNPNTGVIFLPKHSLVKVIKSTRQTRRRLLREGDPAQIEPQQEQQQQQQQKQHQEQQKLRTDALSSVWGSEMSDSRGSLVAADGGIDVMTVLKQGESVAHTYSLPGDVAVVDDFEEEEEEEEEADVETFVTATGKVKKSRGALRRRLNEDASMKRRLAQRAKARALLAIPPELEGVKARQDARVRDDMLPFIEMVAFARENKLFEGDDVVDPMAVEADETAQMRLRAGRPAWEDLVELQEELERQKAKQRQSPLDRLAARLPPVPKSIKRKYKMARKQSEGASALRRVVRAMDGQDK